MTSTRTPDVLRREAFLARFALWMEEHPRHERRAALAQLRTHLDDAAADSSMRAAVESLGSPRTLAREYGAALGEARVLWSRGLAWATGWLALCLLTLAVFVAALAQVAPAFGTEGATARLLWTEVTVVRSAGTASVETVSTVPWALVVAAALLVVGSRLWRVLPGRRPGRP